MGGHGWAGRGRVSLGDNCEADPGEGSNIDIGSMGEGMGKWKVSMQ